MDTNEKEESARRAAEALARFAARYPLTDNPDAEAAAPAAAPAAARPDPLTTGEDALPGGAGLSDDVWASAPDLSYAAHKASFDRTMARLAAEHQFPWAEADRAYAARRITTYTEDPAFRKTVEAYLKKYADLGGPASGGAYNGLVEQFRADIDDVRDLTLNFDLAVDLGVLKKALVHTVGLKINVSLPELSKKNEGIAIEWNTPLFTGRNRMLTAFVEWIKAMGALAYTAGDAEALALWRDVYSRAFKAIGGPNATDEQIRKGMPENTASAIIESISKAHGLQFARGAFVKTARRFWEDGE